MQRMIVQSDGRVVATFVCAGATDDCERLLEGISLPNLGPYLVRRVIGRAGWVFAEYEAWCPACWRAIAQESFYDYLDAEDSVR